MLFPDTNDVLKKQHLIRERMSTNRTKRIKAAN